MEDQGLKKISYCKIWYLMKSLEKLKEYSNRNEKDGLLAPEKNNLLQDSYPAKYRIKE